MILVLKMTKKYHITWYWCQNIRENMVEKKGQKIRAGVSPPPLLGQSPKENIFFFVRASLIIIHLHGQNYPHHTMSISSSMDSESSTTNSPNPRSSQSKNKNKKGKKKKKWSNVDSRDNPPPVQYAAVDRLIFKATKQQKTNNSFCLVFIVNYDNYHKCWSASIWSLCMSFTKTKTQKNSFCTSGHYEKLVQCLYTIYVWWIYYIDAGD